MTRAIAAGLFVWFGVLALEGLLRYLGAQANAPWLVYSKDAMVVGLLAAYAIRTAILGDINKTILLLAAVLAYGVTIGILRDLPLTQVAFGAKMFLPVLAGYLAVRKYRISSKCFVLIYRTWVPLAVVGVFLDWTMNFPWSGSTYEMAGATIEVSRQWGMFGLDRPAGFGRSSFGTATLLLAAFVLYLAASRRMTEHRSRKSRMLDAVITVSLFAAVLITTSKSAILAMVVVTLVVFLYHLARRSGPLVAPLTRTLITVLLVVTLLLGIVPPALSLCAPTATVRALQLDTVVGRAVMYSFVVRIQETWPDAVALLGNGGRTITGRGIGGIGVAQYYFETPAYNPADNLYVYLWVQFGLVLLATFVAYLIYLIVSNQRNFQPNFNLILFCATLSSLGATLNVIEAPALALALGALLALYHGDAVRDH